MIHVRGPSPINAHSGLAELKATEGAEALCLKLDVIEFNHEVEVNSCAERPDLRLLIFSLLLPLLGGSHALGRNFGKIG